MSSYFQRWTCIFPGKMGLSWKSGGPVFDTKEAAEEQASKNCNVIAIPLELGDHLRATQHQLTAAKQKLQELGIRMDYIDDKPEFVELRSLKRIESVEPWIS